MRGARPQHAAEVALVELSSQSNPATTPGADIRELAGVGGFPLVTAYFAQAGRVTLVTMLAAGFAIAASLA
jgi:hypothetical protein